MSRVAGIFLVFAALFLMTSSSAAAPNPAGNIESIELKVGTMQRHYILYEPTGLAPHAPLMIAFHPSGSSAAKMRMMSSAILVRLARERGFAIAYPDGF